MDGKSERVLLKQASDKFIQINTSQVDYSAVCNVLHLFRGVKMQYSERLRNYELEKALFVENNPESTQAEYESFIRLLSAKWSI